jgi:hypothetical protein
MGPIHPRTKKPVGLRLAQTASVVAYSSKGYSNGPTIAGCSKSDGKITVSFNKTMLAEGGALDAIKIQPYYDGTAVVKNKAYLSVGSKMEVLTNVSQFCLQQPCHPSEVELHLASLSDASTGHPKPSSPSAWVFVDIVPGTNPNEVVVDLSKVNGTVYAIRYGWTGDCCSEDPPTASPCPLASCPIMGSLSQLPANPFVAHIVGDKCKCVAPQSCDE